MTSCSFCHYEFPPHKAMPARCPNCGQLLRQTIIPEGVSGVMLPPAIPDIGYVETIQADEFAERDSARTLTSHDSEAFSTDMDESENSETRLSDDEDIGDSSQTFLSDDMVSPEASQVLSPDPHGTDVSMPELLPDDDEEDEIGDSAQTMLSDEEVGDSSQTFDSDASALDSAQTMLSDEEVGDSSQTFDSDADALESSQTMLSDDAAGDSSHTLDSDASALESGQTMLSDVEDAGSLESSQTMLSDAGDEDAVRPGNDRTLADVSEMDSAQTYISDDVAAGAEPAPGTMLTDDPDSPSGQMTRGLSDHSENAATEQTFVSDDWDIGDTGATMVTEDPAGTEAPMHRGAELRTIWAGAVEESNPEMTVKTVDEGAVGSNPNLVIKRRNIAKRDESGFDLLNVEYELIKVLGEGGMGIVFDARQTSIDRSVAVKMLKPATAKNEAQRHKFLAEAVVTGDLDHPNIVPIYDVGTSPDNALFYSMKKVQGTPWLKVVKEKSTTENLEILMRVADAVAFAHARGVVHRDLKPENVMLGDFGEVLVMDWGLAAPTREFRKAASLSSSTSMGGTPAYMAPEMASGPIERIGPLSDVYLLGAILFEIVTGKPPHYGKSAAKCLIAAAKNEIRPTEKTGELMDIALKAMAFRPEDRHASVRAFQAAIRDYQSHSESVLLGTRAEDDLRDAQRTEGYAEFSKAVFGFQEAIELWPGNARAISGEQEAKLAYAKTALRKGDYDLAASLLDDELAEHAAVHQQIRGLQQERDARQQRLKMAKRLVTGLAATMFFVVTGAAIWIGIEANRARQAEHVARQAENEAVVARDDALQAQAKEKTAKEAALLAQQETKTALQKEEVAKNKAILAQQQEEEARKEAVEEQKKAVIAAEKEAKARELAEAAEEAQKYEAYVATIGLAASKIQENDFDTALRLLERCTPELRNWEWGRLMHLCRQSEQKHDLGAPVNAVAVSPDGTRFVAATWNGIAEIRLIQSGKVVTTLKHNGLYLYSVAFSPDGKLVATASDDAGQGVRLWNAETGAPIRSYAGHTDAVLSVAFSRDGSQLLSSSFDGTARLWNTETGAPVRVFEGHNWWVWSAAFSPDETRIVTASQDGTALVWNLKDGTHGAPFTGHRGPVYSAVFRPATGSGPELVATAGYDKRVLVWNPSDVKNFDYNLLVAGSGAEPPKFRPFDGHTAAVRSVQFSADGKLLVSGSQDNTVKVWDVGTGKAIRTFRGHSGAVHASVFTSDLRSVLTASHDHRVMQFSITDYAEIRVLEGRQLEGHDDAVLYAAFGPQGEQIVTASRDRSAKTWAFATGNELRTFEEGHSFLATNAVFFPGGKKLATAAVDNTVRLWDVATGAQLQLLRRTGRSSAVAVSGDGRWVLTGSDDRKAQLWDAETGDLVRVLGPHFAEVTAVAISPDSRWLFTGDANGHGRLFSSATGELVRDLKAHSRKIVAATFLPDNSRLLTASTDKSVAQWDIATGREQTDLILKHPDSIVALAVSPDGRQALTSCEDFIVRVWDLATAREVGRLQTAALPPPANATAEESLEKRLMNSVAFSSDGRRALTADARTKRVHLWEVATGREIRRPQLDGELGPVLDLSRGRNQIWGAGFAPGENILTVGGSDARLWEAATGRELLSFSPNGAVASANFSPDGTELVTGSWDNSIRIWEAATGTPLRTFAGKHEGYINSAVYSPNGKQILTAADDGTAKLLDAATGEVLLTLAHDDRVRQAVFSPDGTWILTGCQDATARLWDAATGELAPHGLLEGHRWAVLAVGFSEDGKYIVTGSEDNTTRVWEAATGKETFILQGHTAAVTSVAFSPGLELDRLRIVTGSRDNTVKVWEARTRKEILTLNGHSEEVMSVTFSPSGEQILTAGRDGKAILWLTVDWKNAATAVTPAIAPTR